MVFIGKPRSENKGGGGSQIILRSKPDYDYPVVVAHVNVGTRPREVRQSTRTIPLVSHWCSESFNSQTATPRGGPQHRHSPESTQPPPSTTCARKCGRAASRSTKTDLQDTSSVTHGSVTTFTSTLHHIAEEHNIVTLQKPLNT